MRALAGFIMGGRSRAVAAVVVTSVLALVFAPLSYLGAGALALVTLRRGVAEGALVAGLALVVAGAVAGLGLGSPMPVVGLALSLWLPVAAGAWLLRASASQGLTLAALGAVAALGLVVFHLAVASPAELWRGVLSDLLGPVFEAQGMDLEPGTLDRMARVVTGVLAVGFVLGAFLSLLLGRWWQALLYNPGGFGEEFRELRLPRGLAAATLVLVVGTLLTDGASPLVSELAGLGTILFALQGLAVAHAQVKARAGSVGWLVGLYAMVFLFGPPAVIALSAAGVLDAMMDFRRRGLGP